MHELFTLLRAEHDRAWELMNALTGGAREDPSGASVRKGLSRQLVSLLAAHELSEELVVWPAVRTHCEDGEQLEEVGLRQEHDLKMALNELSSISPSEEFDECVNTVAAQMRTHLSYEQSQVWPRLADCLTAEHADELAQRWRAARATAATKPHPHVPADPRALGLLMPALNAVDRLTDALSS